LTEKKKKNQPRGPPKQQEIVVGQVGGVETGAFQQKHERRRPRNAGRAKKEGGLGALARGNRIGAGRSGDRGHLERHKRWEGIIKKKKRNFEEKCLLRRGRNGPSKPGEGDSLSLYGIKGKKGGERERSTRIRGSCSAGRKKTRSEGGKVDPGQHSPVWGKTRRTTKKGGQTLLPG